jgi:type I restriction enzyme S subunit
MELVAEKYKKTEVGLIPSDWDVFRLGDCLLKSPDYGINAAAVEFDDTLPTYLRITDISEDGKFISSNKASVNNPLANSYYLEKGDIVFARTGASVGKTYLYNENDGRLVFAGFLIRIKANPEIVDYRYLIYLTQTKTYWAWVSANSMRSGQPGLNSNEYKSFQIPLPPTKAEQTAIATALSDADALISSLEKLIAKKRNIKQGAMQKLLEPKEDWVEISIFQLADEKKELFDDGDWIESEHITDKGIRLIQTGNIGVGSFIEKENQKFIYEESFYKLGCKLLKVGDLLICRLAEPAGRACIFPFIGEEKVITSVDVTIFRPRAEVVNRQFLNQIFSTSNWFKSISDLCGGTTHKRISRGALGRIKILLPQIEEQTRIAAILSDMDAEIAALETKLEKYKKVKLGMMQNLLTGKIRLV